MVRVQIRDNCTPQVFPDVIDVSSPNSPVLNNSPELTQFVTGGIAQYSRYRPLKKQLVLAIVASKMTYDLPDDWIKADLPSFRRATEPRCFPDTVEYMLPNIQISAPNNVTQSAMRYDFYDDQRQLILSAAPVADTTLTFDYFAIHTAATIPSLWVEAALLPACEKALRAIAVDQAVKLQKYKVANQIEIDNSKISLHLQTQADGYRDRFRQEIVNRPIGSMGENDGCYPYF